MKALIQSDAARFPFRDESIHCIVTSPPYYGLRQYEGDHSQGDFPFLGLEDSLDEHIARMVIIGREMWRVLRPDGTVFFNYGDAFYNYRPSINRHGQSLYNARKIRDLPSDLMSHRGHDQGLPDGSLMLIPWKLAIAFQNDGWIIRQVIFWNKTNPVPESVRGWRWEQHRIKRDKSEHSKGMKVAAGYANMLEDAKHYQGIDESWLADYDDCPGCAECTPNDGLVFRQASWRPTSSVEFVFMMSKGLKYYADQEAVREPFETAEEEEYPRRVKVFDEQRSAYAAARGVGSDHADRSASGGYPPSGDGRNPRNFKTFVTAEIPEVLTMGTASYRGAHHATFPEELIAPFIQAACPRWACPVCGQGWAPIVERIAYNHGRRDDRVAASGGALTGGVGKNFPDVEFRTNGYKRTCEHDHTQDEAVPGIVLDPFGGSGTTGKVAKDLLRSFVICDISRPYLDEQAKVRTGTGTPAKALDDLPMFADAGKSEGS